LSAGKKTDSGKNRAVMEEDCGAEEKIEIQSDFLRIFVSN
jgi:hypothetical protein